MFYVYFIFPLDTQLQIGNQMPHLNQNSQQQRQQQPQQATGSAQQQQQQPQNITQQLLAQSIPQRTLLPQNYVTQLGQVTNNELILGIIIVQVSIIKLVGLLFPSTVTKIQHKTTHPTEAAQVLGGPVLLMPFIKQRTCKQMSP